MTFRECQKSNFSDVFVIFLVLFVFLDSLPLHCRGEEYGRDGRKLFSGYNNNKIASDCKVDRAAKDNEGSTICIFKHECIQRGGEVVGRCMDGFLFAACCQLKSDSQYHIAKRPAFVVSNDYPEAETSTDDYDEELAWDNNFKPIIVPGYRATVSQPSITRSNAEEDTRAEIQAEIISEHLLSLAPEDNNFIIRKPQKLDGLFSHSTINDEIDDTTQEEIPITTYYPPYKPSQDIVEFNEYSTDPVAFVPTISTFSYIRENDKTLPTTTKKPSTKYATGYKVPSSTISNNEIDSDIFLSYTPTGIVLGGLSTTISSLKELYPTQSTTNPIFDDKTEIQTSTDDLTNFAATEFNPSISINPTNESIAVSDNDFNGLHEIETTPTLQEDKLNEKLNVLFNVLFGLKGTFKDLYNTVIQNKTEQTNEFITTTVVKTTSTEQYEEVNIEGRRNLGPIDYNDKNLCGIRPLVKSGRIVGGKNATFGAWPWQVILRETNFIGLFRNKCGGVLLTASYVITAAHCQPGFQTSQEVVFGEYDLSKDNEPRKPVTKGVKQFIVHPELELARFENDIALIELESPVQFDAHIIPICLPPDDADFTGRLATVTGWGHLQYRGASPNILQEVQVPVIENSQCTEMYMRAGHMKKMLDSFICAGYENGGKDSCEGDTGNALALEGDDGRWQLVGIASHGIKCAEPNLPGIYMRATFYKSWLQNVTGVY